MGDVGYGVCATTSFHPLIFDFGTDQLRLRGSRAVLVSWYKLR